MKQPCFLIKKLAGLGAGKHFAEKVRSIVFFQLVRHLIQGVVYILVKLLLVQRNCVFNPKDLDEHHPTQNRGHHDYQEGYQLFVHCIQS